MARPYQKKDSEYWGKKSLGTSNGESERLFHPFVEKEKDNLCSSKPEFFGDKLDISTASYCFDNGQSQDKSRSGRLNKSAYSNNWNSYSNIRSCSLPFSINGSGKYIEIKTALEIVNKAYACIGVVRNTIDVMAEIANDDIFLDGGNSASKSFFDAWLNVIDIQNIKEQFFREKYKSGNVFFFSFDGEFKPKEYENYSSDIKKRMISQEKTIQIPIRYILLNPADIISRNVLDSSSGVYSKVLSPFEVSRLKNRNTPEDIAVYKSLPKETKEAIDMNSSEVYMTLDPKRISFSFYKKQDYEPFAIPMVWSVLTDLDVKMAMKKMDAAVLKTVENYILLITMGTEEEKGGVNAENMQALKDLMKNGSIGNVLVSDYTTKAEFVIPDIKKVLGKEKYEVLNKDIQESLQNILNLEGTYSGLSTKLKVFLKKLKEEKDKFLKDFLIPQMKIVGEKLNMKNIPTPKFKEVDFENKEALQRIALRLYELGAITPQQLMEIFENGVYPTPNEIEPEQENFTENRKKGYYNPIVGGVPMIASSSEEQRIRLSREQFDFQKKQSKEKPIAGQGNIGIPEVKEEKENKTPNSSGRPKGTSKAEEVIQLEDLEKVLGFVNEMQLFCEEEMCKKKKLSELSATDKKNARLIIEAVSSANEMENWKEKISECIDNRKNIVKQNIMDEISEIVVARELNPFPASLVYHSKKIK